MNGTSVETEWNKQILRKPRNRRQVQFNGLECKAPREPPTVPVHTKAVSRPFMEKYLSKFIKCFLSKNFSVWRDDYRGVPTAGHCTALLSESHASAVGRLLMRTPNAICALMPPSYIYYAHNVTTHISPWLVKTLYTKIPNSDDHLYWLLPSKVSLQFGVSNRTSALPKAFSVPVQFRQSCLKFSPLDF